MDIHDLVRVLRFRYGGEPAPTCRICGGKMEIGYIREGRVELYCEKATMFTETEPDHYLASKIIRRSRDSDVMALCDWVEQQLGGMSRNDSP